MTLVRTEGMPEPPYTCAICANGPTDNDGNQRPVIFAEGVDIDWGNSLYVCWDCAELIADLVGRVTREGFDKLHAAHEKLKTEHTQLLAKHEEQEETLDTIRKGTVALKKVKEAA